MKKITFIVVIIFAIFTASVTTSCTVWRSPRPMNGPAHIPAHGPKAPPAAKMPRPPHRGPLAQENKRPYGRYAKDGKSVYYQGKKVAGASAASFVDLGSGYGKDARNVYYQGRRILKASPSSFINLGRGYGKDARNVYYLGNTVRGASPDSFRTPRR